MSPRGKPVRPKMPIRWWLDRYEVTEREERACRAAAKALAEGESTNEPGIGCTGPAKLIDRALPDTPWRRRARLSEIALEIYEDGRAA